MAERYLRLRQLAVSLVPTRQTRRLSVFMLTGWVLASFLEWMWTSNHTPEAYESWTFTMQLLWHLEVAFSGMLMWVLFATPIAFLLILSGTLRSRLYGTALGSAFVMGTYGLIRGTLEHAVEGFKYPYLYEEYGDTYGQYVFDGALTGLQTSLEFLIYTATFVLPFALLLYVSPVDPTQQVSTND